MSDAEENDPQQDYPDIAELSDLDKERIKTLTKTKILEWIADQQAKVQSLKQQNSDLQDKNNNIQGRMDSMAAELSMKESKLKKEQDMSAGLMDRLSAYKSQSPTVDKPSVLIITDKLGFNVSKYLIEELESALMDRAELRKILNHDVVVIMTGREDILSGGDGFKLFGRLHECVDALDANNIPLRVCQILPIKSDDFDLDFNIFNRKIATTTYNLDISEVFEKKSKSDIFARNKITIKDDLLQEAAHVIVKQIGKPSVRPRPIQSSSDDDDVTEIAEYVDIQPNQIGRVIDSARRIGKATDTDVKVIKYELMGARRHGVLFCGTRSEILAAKVKVADLLAAADTDDQKSKRPGTGTSAYSKKPKTSK